MSELLVERRRALAQAPTIVDRAFFFWKKRFFSAVSFFVTGLSPKGVGSIWDLGWCCLCSRGRSLFDFAWFQKLVVIASLILWVGEGGVGWVVGWVSGSWLWLASPFGFGRRVPA